MFRIFDGAQISSFCAASCMRYVTINAAGIPIKAG